MTLQLNTDCFEKIKDICDRFSKELKAIKDICDIIDKEQKIFNCEECNIKLLYYENSVLGGLTKYRYEDNKIIYYCKECFLKIE
jgi:hypothetical protein